MTHRALNLTATEVVAGLRSGEWTSLELVDLLLDRIAVMSPSTNAVVTVDADRARAEAADIDRRRAAGEPLGRLAGLPMTLKDTWETAGMRTTAGSPDFAEHVPAHDAPIVAAIRAADGVVVGKTNTPLLAGDHQSYNDVFGITDNPWMAGRTAGGSSGGAAAAIASGQTWFEVGSDIGASIRLPAHMNGTFGLKPTHDVVPLRGHIPGPPGTMAPGDLAVAGPLGRSIADLELLLEVMLDDVDLKGIPGARLPAPEPVEVASLRVGLWADDDEAPVQRHIVDEIGRVGRALADAGATVDSAVRPDIPSDRLHDVYLRLLMAEMGAGMPADVRSMLRDVAAASDPDDRSDAVRQARYMTMDHRDWVVADEARHKAIAAWDRVFDTVDVVIAPAAPRTAFPHTTELPYPMRTLDIDGVERPYSSILFWAGIATMPLLPSVVIPVGHDAEGLPCGVQLIGPAFTDRRLLRVAAAIAEVAGSRFRPAPDPT